MSMLTIKSDLESHLKLNLSNVAIKWNNTNHYTKNNAPLGTTEIDALTFFIEPSIIPISDERELISSDKPFSTEIFFQIGIYNKLNQGTGEVYSVIEDLNTLFREKYINSTICDRATTINSYVVGDWEITPHRLHCILWN